MKKLALIVLSIVTTLSSFAPSYAFPSAGKPAVAQSSDVQTVQARDEWRDRDRDRRWRRDRDWRDDRWDRRDRRDRREWRDRGHRYGWHRGHRGYRDYRRGYRRHSDGFWYPLAAFGAGAIIGGAIASQPRYVEPAPAVGVSGAHIDWCANRYRSYRAYDNTFQPYGGPRQQCISPYL
ncbi:MAG: BA14K family protein [Shinella sp.]|nr:BA14K family protein [Shinella sp.]